MATDPVLEPFQLKGLRLKNRVMSTAHAPSYVEDGKPKLRYRLYHEEKAKGGLALTMFGGSTTTATGQPVGVRPDQRGQRRDHPLVPAAGRHRASARLRADVPDHAYGAAHLRRRRGLAADPGAEPGARAAAPLVPQDDRAARDQARAEGLRRRGAALPGRRARRGRGDRLGPPGRPVPLARASTGAPTPMAAAWRTAAGSRSRCSARSARRWVRTTSSASASPATSTCGTGATRTNAWRSRACWRPAG